MSDAGGLGRRLGKLEQRTQVRRSYGPAAWRELLAETFAGAAYDAQRDALIDALCNAQEPNPRYELRVTDDEGREQARELIIWTGREHGDPPVIIRFTNDWRGVRG